MSNVFSSPDHNISFKERCIIAWKDLDDYTQKYSKYINRRITATRLAIKRVKYDNNLMNRWQRFLFPFHSFAWRIRYHLENILLR